MRERSATQLGTYLRQGLIGGSNVRFSRGDRRFRHITRARDHRDVPRDAAESLRRSHPFPHPRHAALPALRVAIVSILFGAIIGGSIATPRRPTIAIPMAPRRRRTSTSRILRRCWWPPRKRRLRRRTTPFAVTERIGRFQAGLAGFYSFQVADDMSFGVPVAPDGRRMRLLDLGGVVAYDMSEIAASMKLKVVSTVITQNSPAGYGIALSVIKKLH